MVKNRGETLIESLISMFFVTVAIIPIANLFLKTFQTDVKVDDLNKKNVNMGNVRFQKWMIFIIDLQLKKNIKF